MNDKIVIKGAKEHKFKKHRFRNTKKQISSYNWTFRVLANLH